MAGNCVAMYGSDLHRDIPGAPDGGLDVRDLVRVADGVDRLAADGGLGVDRDQRAEQFGDDLVDFLDDRFADIRDRNIDG